MTYEIIKGVPLPKPRRPSNLKYPFADMEVGDAFDAPRDMGRTAKGNDMRQNSVSVAARGYSKTRTNGAAKFTVRILDENTVRCWRIA